MSAGSITRISGPVIYARGLEDAALRCVKVGAAALRQIIKLKGDLATIQITKTHQIAWGAGGVLHRPLSSRRAPV
jgi:vacuolar-type H+-ATPase catalytic subunit A/Vma1